MAAMGFVDQAEFMKKLCDKTRAISQRVEAAYPDAVYPAHLLEGRNATMEERCQLDRRFVD